MNYKLSELVEGWPEKDKRINQDTDGWDNHGDIADEYHDRGYVFGYNKALTACDKEVMVD